MLNELTRNWWVMLIRGLIAIAFGIMAFFWPGLTLFALILLFGAYALVDGIMSIALGMSGRTEGSSWWPMLLLGLVGIGVGIYAFVYPAITAFLLLIVIAMWAIVRGIFEIVAAIRLRKEIANEWMMGLAGALSVLFGILLLAWPAAGILAMVWLIAIYAIAFGILMVGLAFRLLALRKRHERPMTGGTTPHPV